MEVEAAMSQFSFVIDDRQLRGLSADLSPSKINAILRRGINETARQSQSAIVKGVANSLNLRQKFIRSDRVTLRRAVGGNLSAKVAVSDKPVPMREFLGSDSRAERYVGQQRPGRPPLRVTVRKGKRETLSTGFVARIRQTGQIQVFKRYGSKKRITRGPRAGKFAQPLTLLRGPTIAGAFSGISGLQAQVLADTGSRLEKNIDRAINLALAKKAGLG